MNAGQSERKQLPPQLPPAQVPIPATHAKAMRLVTRAQALVDQAMADPDALIVWPGPISEALNKLTAKQRQYAIRTGAGQPDIQAYLATYDVDENTGDDVHYSNISRLNSHSKVSHVQLILRDWLSQKWLLDATEVKDYAVSKLYEESAWAGKSSDRIKATELLLRVHGQLVDKKEVTHRDATEHDEQAALFRSIIDDLKLAPVLEAEYVQSNQLLSAPTLGTLCLACNLRAKLDGPFEDGAGI